MHQFSHDVVKLLLGKLVLKYLARDGHLNDLTGRGITLVGGTKETGTYGKFILTPADDEQHDKYKWLILITGPTDKASIYFREDGEHLITWESDFPPGLYNEKIPAWMLQIARNY